MIEGLHLDVGTEELRKHFEARVMHHRVKEDWYLKKGVEIKGGFDDDESRSKMSNTVSNPAQQFESSAKRHRALASRFAFMATHLIANETYRFEEGDLSRLELTESEY